MKTEFLYCRKSRETSECLTKSAEYCFRKYRIANRINVCIT